MAELVSEEVNMKKSVVCLLILFISACGGKGPKTKIPPVQKNEACGLSQLSVEKASQILEKQRELVGTSPLTVGLENMDDNDALIINATIFTEAVRKVLGSEVLSNLKPIEFIELANEFFTDYELGELRLIDKINISKLNTCNF